MDHVWNLQHDREVILPTLGSPGAENICVANGRLQLRRLDEARERFQFDGAMEAGEVSLRPWTASGLESLFGVRAALDDAGGAVEFRISVDGGGTFQWWDDVAGSWQPATTGVQWNDLATMDLHLPDLDPRAGRSIVPRVRLTPAVEATRSPSLRSVSMYGDVAVDWEDDLFRTLKRYLQAHVSARTRWRGQAAGNLVTVETRFDIKDEPVSAFDITADPDRRQDLFASRAGNVLTLSSSPPGTVEVRFRGGAHVHLVTDEHVELQRLPAITLQFSSQSEARRYREAGCRTEWAAERLLVRQGDQPVLNRATVLIGCHTHEQNHLKPMVAAVSRLLQQHRAVTSLATGEDIQVADFGPITDSSNVGRGLASATITATMMGPAWVADSDVEVPLATSLHVGAGDMNRNTVEEQVVS